MHDPSIINEGDTLYVFSTDGGRRGVIPTLYSLYSRERTGPHQTPPVEGVAEAPFIIKHDE